LNNNSISKKISLSGIMLAFVTVVLFAATTLPTSRLSLYALSSFLVSIIIIEFGVKSGWIFFIASSILTLIIIPDKLGLLPYAFFFGIYGIVKFHIEKLNNLIIEYFLKIVFFNICMFSGLFLIKEFLFSNLEIKFPIWVIIVAFEIIFIIYDYVYTLFIHYYNEKLKKILKI
jgi:hypothetical protein